MYKAHAGARNIAIWPEKRGDQGEVESKVNGPSENPSSDVVEHGFHLVYMERVGPSNASSALSNHDCHRHTQPSRTKDPGRSMGDLIDSSGVLSGSWLLSVFQTPPKSAPDVGFDILYKFGVSNGVEGRC